MKTESLTTEEIEFLKNMEHQGGNLPEPLASKLARAEGIQLYYKHEAPAEPSTHDPVEEEAPDAEEGNKEDGAGEENTA